MKRTTSFRFLCFFIAVLILTASVAFATDRKDPEKMSLLDYLEYNGVTVKSDTIICVKSTDSDNKEQYIEVTNHLPGLVIEKTFIKPYANENNVNCRIIDSNDGYIPTRSSGYVPVNFSSIGITVTTQAYYTGTDVSGFVPSGVSAKWTRGTGITNVVDSMHVEFYIRGILIDLSTGDPIDEDDPERLYNCELNVTSPYMNVFYTKYKTLEQSGTGLWTGQSPLYGGGVIVNIEVNGHPYEDAFSI